MRTPGTRRHRPAYSTPRTRSCTRERRRGIAAVAFNEATAGAPSAVEALERYAAVELPVLLMVGTSSPDRQQANRDAVARVLPDVHVARLPGLGHVAHNADPDHVAALIGSFLHRLK